MPSRNVNGPIEDKDLHQSARVKTKLDGHREQRTHSKEELAIGEAARGRHRTESASVANLILMTSITSDSWDEQQNEPCISISPGIVTCDDFEKL
jgi:hypothetical protein